MAAILDEELQTYDKLRSELIGRSEGKFALIHGNELVGVYETKPDAIAEGYRHFGNVPFLVKQIVQVEAPQNFVSNHLAI